MDCWRESRTFSASAATSTSSGGEPPCAAAEGTRVKVIRRKRAMTEDGRRRTEVRSFWSFMGGCKKDEGRRIKDKGPRNKNQLLIASRPHGSRSHSDF